MKYYTLETINNGKTVRINKKFNTRTSAIDYAFDYFEKHIVKDGLHDARLEEEFAIDNNKHNVEYVLDYNNRFRVNRVQVNF